MTARAVLVLILILNWLVAGSKLIVGYMMGSLALQGDGFHSFIDGLSNVVGIVSLSIAVQPADEDHPYGHQKFETFATLGVSFLIMLTAAELIRDGITNILSPSRVIVAETKGFVVLVVTLAVNIFVVWWERRKARELNSAFLEADATHTLSDVMVTVGVLAGLVAMRAGHVWIDTWIAIGIGLFIAHVGFGLLLRTLPVLVDAKAISQDELKPVVMSVQGIESCHKIRSRGSEDEIYIDLHIQVSPHMTVLQAHDISHRAKDRIIARFEGVRDVTIHIEPRDDHAHDQA